jgi:hypothetical protein
LTNIILTDDSKKLTYEENVKCETSPYPLPISVYMRAVPESEMWWWVRRRGRPEHHI